MEKSHGKPANGNMFKGKELGQDEINAIMTSVSNLVSNEVSDLMRNLSKQMPKVTTQFLKKNWKPVAVSAAAAAVIGVGTFILNQKTGASETRAKGLLN